MRACHTRRSANHCAAADHRPGQANHAASCLPGRSRFTVGGCKTSRITRGRSLGCACSKSRRGCQPKSGGCRGTEAGGAADAKR
jgi:hypothetical protein